MKTEATKRNIAGAILAGGNACRMNGLAKGTLKTAGGISIVEQLITEFNQAGIRDVIIVTNDSGLYQYCGIEIISDLRSGVGPVAGIEAGLNYFVNRSDAVLFIPCDMPKITAKQIWALKKAFILRNTPVVFAKTGDFFWHPLCAVVHNDLFRDISTAIDFGARKVRALWCKVGASSLLFEDESCFFNINNHDDLNRWQIQCKGKNENKNFCTKSNDRETLRILSEGKYCS